MEFILSLLEYTIKSSLGERQLPLDAKGLGLYSAAQRSQRTALKPLTPLGL